MVESKQLPVETLRELAISEGTRVYILVLRALISELGVDGTRKFAGHLGALPVDNEADHKVRERLRAMLSAATAHAGEFGAREDDTDWTVDRAWRDARTVGARVYALALQCAFYAFGPDRTRQLASVMDEVSVEDADIYAVRELLGLPEKRGEGTIEDWINFLGTGWTMLADKGTDWEWTEVSDTRATMRVYRCPYFTQMGPELRAAQPCEMGCSAYLDTAAQRVHPQLRLRGDPEAVGYAKSLPKGDDYCELAVAFVSERSASGTSINR